MLTNSSILITGGTGSFGHAFVSMTLAKYNPRRLVIYSRDEMKQWEMAKIYKDDDRVRFISHRRTRTQLSGIKSPAGSFFVNDACASGKLSHVRIQRFENDSYSFCATSCVHKTRFSRTWTRVLMQITF